MLQTVSLDGRPPGFDRLPHVEGLARLGDVVNAHNMDALGNGVERRSKRARDPIANRLALSEGGDEALARYPQGDGAAVTVKKRQPAQNLSIVGHCLTKADTRIDGDGGA